MKDTTDEMLNRLRDNWLPAEELPTVSVDEYLNLLNANWIEPDAPQEAAKRGGRFRVEPRVYGRGGAIVVRHFRAGGDGPERTFIPVGSVRVYTDADGYTRVDIIESADPDIAAYLNYDTDAHTDANPDRDAVPDVDAAADVDGAPDADGDGDVDAGGDANNPISRHRAARRAERAFFDNAARLAGLPRTPGACTFVWRDAPMGDTE